jgi:hypothetical protein
MFQPSLKAAFKCQHHQRLQAATAAKTAKVIAPAERDRREEEAAR